MKQTKQPYVGPEMTLHTIGVQRCIALSCGNESYSSDAGSYDENGNEDLVIDNGAW